MARERAENAERMRSGEDRRPGWEADEREEEESDGERL